MAYIYGNAMHVSVAVFVLGLIEVLMWVACFFGCQEWGEYDYGITVLAGVFVYPVLEDWPLSDDDDNIINIEILNPDNVMWIPILGAMWTGIFGICMTKKTLDRRLGGGFLCSNIVLMFICIACILLNTYAGLQEYEYITRNDGSSDNEATDVTGLVIFGTIDVFTLALLIAACYASCMNCCCEPLPPKEFGFSYLNHEQRDFSFVDANYV